MQDRSLAAAAWAAFVIVVGAAGHFSLRACDLGGSGLFGLRYCDLRAEPDRLAAERERERDLRDRIHNAELRVARLPVCAPPEELTIPRTLADVDGCWQSVRGDIQMYSDDAERRPTAKVRICFCFGGQHGSARYIDMDGGKCIGPLRVQLAQESFSFSHGRIDCAGRSFVPADIVCKGGECETLHHGRELTRRRSEKFQRVPPQHCE